MSKHNVVICVLLLFIISITTSAQDTLLDIRKQAVKDAKKDVNSMFWNLLGGCVGGASCVGSVLVGVSTGKKTFNDGSQQFPDINVWGLAGTCLGGVTILPLISVAIKPALPPERLLGKSADYIETYSETYTKTVRKQRLKHSCLGIGIGSFLTVFYTIHE